MNETETEAETRPGFWSWTHIELLLACMCGWLVFVFALCVTLEIVQIVQQLQSVQRLFVLISLIGSQLLLLLLQLLLLFPI